MSKRNSTAAKNTPETNGRADLKQLEIDINSVAEKLDGIHETLLAAHESGGESARGACLIVADVVLAQNNALSAALERLDEIQREAQTGKAPAADTESDAADLDEVVAKLCELRGAVIQAGRGDDNALSDLCSVVSDVLQLRIDDLNAYMEHTE